jgi:hypothetical protein
VSPRRSLIIATAIAAALAAPASALAQSAGDDQYTDPFSDEPATPQSPPEQPSTPPASGGDASASTVDTEIAPSATDAQADEESGATLPVTGLPVVALAGAGVALLLGGVGLRRLG